MLSFDDFKEQLTESTITSISELPHGDAVIKISEVLPMGSDYVERIIKEMEMDKKDPIEAFAKTRELKLERDRNVLSKIYAECKKITSVFEKNLSKETLKHL